MYDVDFNIKYLSFPDPYGQPDYFYEDLELTFFELDWEKWITEVIVRHPCCCEVWMSYLPPLTQGDPVTHHWEKREGKWFSIQHVECYDVEPRIESAPYLDAISR